METSKTKPFPWMCPNCRQKTVLPVQKDYTLTAEHDGAGYDVTIHDVLVPTCSQCGQAIITNDLSQRTSAELRRLLGLLTPEKIHAKREELGMTHAQLAAALRVGEATLIRWETGLQLQPRAMDLLLRLYFDSADVRRACVAPPVAGPGSPQVSGTNT
jgi:putative zinc finger/helix-turn-helix YgiT family protein